MIPEASEPHTRQQQFVCLFPPWTGAAKVQMLWPNCVSLSVVAGAEHDQNDQRLTWLSLVDTHKPYPLSFGDTHFVCWWLSILLSFLHLWVCPNIGYTPIWSLYCGKWFSKPPNLVIAFFQSNPDIAWSSLFLSHSDQSSHAIFYRKSPIFPVSQFLFSRAHYWCE